MAKKTSSASCHVEGAVENACNTRKGLSFNHLNCAEKTCGSGECTRKISEKNHILFAVQQTEKVSKSCFQVWKRLPVYSRLALVLCIFPIMVVPLLTGLLLLPLGLAILVGVYCAAFSPTIFFFHLKSTAEEYVNLEKLASRIQSKYLSIYSKLSMEKTKNFLLISKQKGVDVASILYYKFIAFLYILYASTATKAKNTLSCSVDVLAEPSNNTEDSSPMFDLPTD